jgi:hypothetical protein
MDLFSTFPQLQKTSKLKQIMKSKKISLLCFLLLLGTACSQDKKLTLAPEYLFDNEGLLVVTSSFNNRYQTMSVLYSNAVAQKHIDENSALLLHGEEYRFVTWNQKGNPLWFGGNINGAIRTIERVTTSRSEDGTVEFHYQLCHGLPSDLSGTGTVDESSRIKYILAQKASLFP